MKRTLLVFIILIGIIANGQNSSEGIEADYEMQGYFKDFSNFNLNVLFETNFSNNIYSIDKRRSQKFLEREIDNGVIESQYRIHIEYQLKDNKQHRYKEYQIYTFKKDNQIFGLISYDRHRESVNHYFDYTLLRKYLKERDEFYEKNSSIADFITDITTNEIYGYFCGFAPISYDVPRFKDLSFDKKKNVDIFRSWLTSNNAELQTYGADAMEYLSKKKNFKLKDLDIKLIKYIKKRNSILNTCSGCLIGIYKKAY